MQVSMMTAQLAARWAKTVVFFCLNIEYAAQILNYFSYMTFSPFATSSP